MHYETLKALAAFMYFSFSRFPVTLVSYTPLFNSQLACDDAISLFSRSSLHNPSTSGFLTEHKATNSNIILKPFRLHGTIAYI